MVDPNLQVPSTGSLPAARFSWFLVALYVVSLFRLHEVEVFKVLSRSRRRTAGRCGQSTVPQVVKLRIASDPDLLPCVDLEIHLILDFFLNLTIFGPFAVNAHIAFPVSNPGKTHK